MWCIFATIIENLGDFLAKSKLITPSENATISVKKSSDFFQFQSFSKNVGRRHDEKD
jgi:hypothetical protein